MNIGKGDLMAVDLKGVGCAQGEAYRDGEHLDESGGWHRGLSDPAAKGVGALAVLARQSGIGSSGTAAFGNVALAGDERGVGDHG